MSKIFEPQTSDPRENAVKFRRRLREPGKNGSQRPRFTFLGYDREGRAWYRDEAYQRELREFSRSMGIGYGILILLLGIGTALFFMR